MSFEQRCPVVLLCSGAFNPITVGHVKMFEIARNFLERTGNHIVISGILSPIHDLHGKTDLVPASHRVAMCKIAIQKHPWLSVDGWQCSQNDWVKTIKVLHHVKNKVKNDFGVAGPYSNPIYYTPARYPRNTVTLQPSGELKSHLHNDDVNSTNRNSFCSPVPPVQDDILELNEASEPDKTGVVLNRLSNNLMKVCCVRPMPLAFAASDNMVYGATYDLRRTKVFLLCGSDLLESFGVPGLWTDGDIKEIVTEYGIVCIPRSNENSSTDNGKTMRDALDRLQRILSQSQGTVILVNDRSRAEIFNVTSSQCRNAMKSGELDDARDLMNSDVLQYTCDRRLYSAKDNPAC